MVCKKADSESVELTAECIKKGGVVVVPTDTVYGFSSIVDLKNKTSFCTQSLIQKIKGRGEDKPFIQLIAKPQDLAQYTEEILPPELLSLWPGPLTVIVKIKKDSPLAACAETVAFRCPGDQWLRSVIEKCGAPIYSTSVNRSGKAVLSNLEEIKEEFGKEVDLIVDDGDKKNAVPSTIVKLEDSKIVLVRNGALDVSAICGSIQR